MPYKGEKPTLSALLCYPFLNKITRKSIFGGPYVRGADLLGVESQLYSIGAVLGHALRNKLDILAELLFVLGTEDHKVNEVMRLCKKDAKKNLEEYRNEFGREPDTFDDFAFYWGIENLLRTKGISLSPRDAFEAYLDGDRKVKKLFDIKVDADGVDDRIIIMLLQGIHFGSTFPELTEKMYQKAYKNDMDEMDTWTRTWAYGLTIPKEFAVMDLEETEKTTLQMVAAYTSEYYPELLDPLDLRGYLEV